MIRAALLIFLTCIGSTAFAVDCENIEFEGNRYAVCEIDAANADLRLFLRDDAGEVLGQFSTVNKLLKESGETLAFAMNAGMYHADRAPVGHYIENGQEEMRVISNAGPGNFGMLPNGIFCIRDKRADVIETLDYLSTRPQCTHATQSGPMLVIGGELHPRFLENSTSRYIRNGVGTSADGARVVFAMSRNTVNFHSFGRLFQAHLDLPNALYFDGNISRFYAPTLNRDDAGFRMGPIVGVVTPGSAAD